MTCNDYINKLEPYRLYIVLVLTLVYFFIELVFSHVTHSLTLLIDSYHMLCNIIALIGCLITISSLKKEHTKESEVGRTRSQTITDQENKLMNTFGWTRIDILVMLICFILTVSFCFSLFVEAVQTLIHIDHHDEMHYPIQVLIIGIFGLVLNGICYFLIGGYTFRQENFLYVTTNGDIAISKVSSKDTAIEIDEMQCMNDDNNPDVPTQSYRRRQNFHEICRDSTGAIFTIICAISVYILKDDIGKFIDPAIAIISAILLIILSYPYMKESGYILLQTIPASINIDALQNDLLQTFPEIVNIHDFHIWQLTRDKVISTVHIVFQNLQVYAKVKPKLSDIFTEYGVTRVTIQPEFLIKTRSIDKTCLMQCSNDLCKDSLCCQNNLLFNNSL